MIMCAHSLTTLWRWPEAHHVPLPGDHGPLDLAKLDERQRGGAVETGMGAKRRVLDGHTSAHVDKGVRGHGQLRGSHDEVTEGRYATADHDHLGVEHVDETAHRRAQR